MADMVTKQYMRENTVFADAFNFLLYDGENVIRPENLKELDTTELVVPFAVDNTDNRQAEAVQKYRDILKMTTVMTDDTAAYVLLGVESQTDVHYAMIDVTEMDKFQTSLREVLCYIKYSKDADKFTQYMKNNRRMEQLELNAAQVIREVTNTKFQIPKGTEVVNVCQAVEVLMDRRKNEGIQQGITQGKLSLLQDLINDGTLTIEAAAAKADMTVEEFTESIKKL